MKSSWKVLLETAGKTSNKKSNIDSINVNGIDYQEPVDIANNFTDFFASIAESTVENIPPTTRSHDSFPFNPVSEIFEFKKIDQSTIENIIKNFSSKKSTDINGLSTNLLKSCSDLILRPLTHLINLSLAQGVFPGDLSTSRTVPIFKQGRRNEMSNYRPISLLPILSKVYEKVVFNQLFDYLSINNILSKNQFGFQPSKSTQQTLIQILNYIAQALNENKFVVACMLDLSKAFDLINHNILLEKLKKIGLSDTCLKWFRSYLSNRKMYVFINGSLSTKVATLVRSVPQGSILGPLLFLIFINDMPLATSLDCFLYADDNTTLTSGTDLKAIGPLVNLELQKLGQWLRANELAINTSKTKIMIFSNKKIIPEFPFVFNQNDIECTVDNPNFITPIERISNNSTTPYIKLLGVYFDEHLTFDHHVDKVCKKVNSAFFHFNAVKNFLSIKALTKLYFALIHPHFVYCLPVYSFTNARNRKRLSIKQKQCIRIICKSKYNAHSEPLFYKLKILPFEDLIVQHKLIFMQSLAHNHSVVKFPHFIRNSEANLHRFDFRNESDFFVDRTNYQSVKKMPYIDFPSTWNSIDSSLKEISSKPLFKKTIKLELLDKISNFQCNKTLCISCMNI